MVAPFAGTRKGAWLRNLSPAACVIPSLCEGVSKRNPVVAFTATGVRLFKASGMTSTAWARRAFKVYWRNQLDCPHNSSDLV